MARPFFLCQIAPEGSRYFGSRLIRTRPKGDAKLSSDGAWILYASVEHTVGEAPPAVGRLMRLPVSGGAPEKVLEGPAATSGFDCPSRPSGSCVFNGWEQGQLIFYALDPVQGRGKELARTRMGQPAASAWKISPDGSRVAIFGGDLPHTQVRILDLRDTVERNLQLPHGWIVWNLSWAVDGDALLVAAQSKATGYLIARVEIDGKSKVLIDRGRNQWLGYPILSPDGRHLAFAQQTFETNVWLVENFR
jgi:Tol biopolymer transport system component